MIIKASEVQPASGWEKEVSSEYGIVALIKSQKEFDFLTHMDTPRFHLEIVIDGQGNALIDTDIYIGFNIDSERILDAIMVQGKIL